MRKKQSILVSTENGGLGNRLKSWVSVMRMTDQALVYWETNNSMPANFSELFTNECEVKALSKEMATHKSWLLSILPEDEKLLPYMFSAVCSPTHPLIRGIGKAYWRLSKKNDDKYRYMIFPKTHSKKMVRPDARHIDMEYERIPLYFKELYSKLFQKIQVNEVIKNISDSWSRENIEENTVGIQIRTWRDYPYRHNKYYKPSIRRLIKLIEKEANCKFLVVSDNDEVVDFLISMFGKDRILSFPRKTSRSDSWNSISGIKEDLIDMLILSKTNKIFASYLSTFSECAWWIGGAKATVTVF